MKKYKLNNETRQVHKLTNVLLGTLLDKDLAKDFYTVSIEMMSNNKIVKEIRITKHETNQTGKEKTNPPSIS